MPNMHIKKPVCFVTFVVNWKWKLDLHKPHEYAFEGAVDEYEVSILDEYKHQSCRNLIIHSESRGGARGKLYNQTIVISKTCLFIHWTF